MQSEKRLFDDLAKMINGVAGTVAGAGREAEASMRERMREWVGGLDLISREEFDAVKEMATKARAENEVLKKRLDAFEKQAGKKKVVVPKPTTKKPVAKKPASNIKKTVRKKTTPKK